MLLQCQFWVFMIFIFEFISNKYLISSVTVGVWMCIQRILVVFTVVVWIASRVVRDCWNDFNFEFIRLFIFGSSQRTKINNWKRWNSCFEVSGRYNCCILLIFSFIILISIDLPTIILLWQATLILCLTYCGTSYVGVCIYMDNLPIISLQIVTILCSGLLYSLFTAFYFKVYFIWWYCFSVYGLLFAWNRLFRPFTSVCMSWHGWVFERISCCMSFGLIFTLFGIGARPFCVWVTSDPRCRHFVVWGSGICLFVSCLKIIAKHCWNGAGTISPSLWASENAAIWTCKFIFLSSLLSDVPFRMKVSIEDLMVYFFTFIFVLCLCELLNLIVCV